MATTIKEKEIEGVLSRPVVHILIVGFHHQKGSTIEYSYPPLLIPSKAKESITTSIGESCWRYLPHLALPDGCHNYDEESVYFTLPDPEAPESCLFGVACCRQIETRELPQVDKQVTRSTIQKSVCVLCRYPAFGFIQAKLSLVTHAFFNAKDFSNVEILQETYKGINSALSSQSQINSVLHLSVSNRGLVLLYHHRLLQLVKALLLQKRVLVYGAPSLQVCASVLSIVSLFPGSLEKYTGAVTGSKSDLNVFPNASSAQPYLCLQQMEELRGQSQCVLAGVVNPLFEKQHSKLCDVFADMSSGLLSIAKPSLKSALHLSAADLRFCSLLSDTVGEQETEQSDWLGSDAWIRAQFKHYLISLLKTTLEGEEAAKKEFNPDFMSAWCESPVYKSWLTVFKSQHSVTTVEPRAAEAVSTGEDLFANSPPLHVCTGELSVSDLKRKLLAQASDYGLKVQSREEVVQQTRHAIAMTTEHVTSAVSRAWTSASSAVYNWWGGGGQNNND